MRLQGAHGRGGEVGARASAGSGSTMGSIWTCTVPSSSLEVLSQAVSQVCIFPGLHLLDGGPRLAEKISSSLE